MSKDESLKKEDKFSASKRRRLLWVYLKTNVIIGFMLTAELFRGIFRLFIPTRPKCIKDKLALITGGGHGIGRALALKIAERGCHIAIADIDDVAAAATIAEIAEKHKVKAASFRVDVSKYEQVKQLRKDVEATLGCVDLLVNNVGLLALDVSLREQTAERIQHVVNVNLMSHFWVVREFLDGMIERNYGHIIASGSFAGKVTLPTAITYSTTKFGVTGFMSALYDELCVYGHDEIVKTSTIYPLFVDTSDELAEMAGEMPLWPAKRVAQIMLDGVLKNERNIYVPRLAKISTMMNSLPDRIIKYVKVTNFNKFSQKRLNERKSVADIV